MFSNYLLLAIRNILKQRGYAMVNTVGLSVGLAAAIFILLYVRDELTFDTIHPHAAQTYRMGYWLKDENGQINKFPEVPAGWDNYLKENYPQVTHAASYIQYGMPTSIHDEAADKIILTESIIWAEPGMRDMLALFFISGDANTALNEPNSIIISEAAAQKLFSNGDALDKHITLSHQWVTNNQKVDMVIKGVYRDFPSNSHIQPQYIGNIFTLKPFNENFEKRINTGMGTENDLFWTQSYFVCTDEKLVPVIIDDLQKRANAAIAQLKLDIKFKPMIRKITDVHFDKEMDWSVSHKSADKNYMYVFISIAILILVVACVNYINLAVAKSATRAKEIGLRKTFGSERMQLFTQFMLESFLLVMMAVIIALLMVMLLLPQFNTLAHKTFVVAHLFQPGMLAILLAVMLFVTLLGGSYPAIFISGFQPASVLKGKFAFRKGSNVFRQFLIGLQFTVALILLIGSVVLVRQMDLMRNSKLNEAGEQIVSVRFGGFGGKTTDSQYNVYKQMLLQDPQIESVTLANHLPRMDHFGPINMRFSFPDVQEEPFEWFQLNGDYDFPKTFGLKFLAGRSFDPQNVTDSTAVILNETAVKTLKLTPAEALGQAVMRPANSYYYLDPRDTTSALYKPRYGKVIGVVEDFPFRSMNHKIEPLGIAGKPHFDDRIIHVRVNAKNIGEKIQAMEKTWKQVFPQFGFDYWFLDDEFGRMYEQETRIAGLTEKFSILAMLITCIGLYGLASFMAQQRTREIGIRKALGSSSGQIVKLLLAVFGKLLLIASLVSIPVTYLLTTKWLERFAYQTPLSVWVFVVCLLAIAIVTLLTVGFETWRAARTNPVESLRHE